MDAYKRAMDTSIPVGQRLKHFSYRVDWLRDLPPGYLGRINAMVKRWHELGVITPQQGTPVDGDPHLPAECWVEEQRKDFGGADPSFQQVLHAEHSLHLRAAFVKQGERQSVPLKRNQL
jgi:hypothetical protein